MGVRCSKCGEELLGSVNRCWKCGQTFALRPEIDGRPPVRTERASPAAVAGPPLEAVVLGEATGGAATDAAPAASAAAHAVPQPATPPRVPVARPRVIAPLGSATADMIDARRAGMMAMGGTVASLVLGLFAAFLALLWPPAAVIAVLGLVMGIWGLYSPRRNWALLGMLLCCLAIGLGMYGGVRRVHTYLLQQRAITIDGDTAY
jgi:hypothetical protein